MKAVLEFELPQEEVEFIRSVEGRRWSTALWDVDESLRRLLKYSEGLTNEQRKCYEEARGFVLEALQNYNLDFDI